MKSKKKLIPKMIRSLSILFLVFLFMLMSFICIYFQVKAEQYLSFSKSEYGIFTDKKRISYIPFVFFHIKNQFDHDFYKKYSACAFFPYKEKDFEEGFMIIINESFNTYYMYCFYSSEEVEAFQCS